jgi:hypothetical protein
MAKVIRHTYPKELSIGLLILIFFLSFFLSSQIFDVAWKDLFDGEENAHLGMALVAVAVVIMVLILWEDFLFHVKIKPEADHVVFRNHPTKLKAQIVMYLAIPVIFAFIYYQFDVRPVRFAIWATVCIVLPVIATLISGIKNYNDFLKLGTDTIGYKNNEKEGDFPLGKIQQIRMVRDDRKVLHKLTIVSNGQETLIDLDEMELDAYLDVIDKFIVVHYPKLVNKPAT